MVRLQKVAKNGNGRIRWKHFALFSFAKTSSNVSEIPKTHDYTNVQYSENTHKEESRPQLPETNSDRDTIYTEREQTTSQNVNRQHHKM